jgi:hypothetical protein
MASGAEDVANRDVRGVRNDDTIILVPHFTVFDKQIYTIPYVKRIGIVCCRETVADGIRCIAERIVDYDIPDRRVKDTSDVYSMGGEILDVQVAHSRVVRNLDFHKLARSMLLSYSSRTPLPSRTVETYFGSPPFPPRPSQYCGPPPSITDPGAPTIVTLLPEIWIGLN